MGDYMKKYISVILAFFVLASSILYCRIEKTSSKNIIQNNLPIIVIDAGHGGEDGGAVASDGTVEKKLNLEIALKLNDVLSIMGYKTKLIRKTDTAIHTPAAASKLTIAYHSIPLVIC